MRRRTAAFLGLGTAVAVLEATPAGAANQTVGATFSNLFSPRVVAVKPGETVTFVNRGGVHDVDWEDAFATQPPRPAEGWTVQRTFARNGAFRYFCSLHGARGGVGQAGVVYVTAGGAVPPPGFVSLSATGSAGGISLRVNATERGTLRGSLQRGSATAGTFARSVLGGPNAALRVTRTSAGPLAPGRYRLVVRLASGPRTSAPRTLLVTVS